MKQIFLILAVFMLFHSCKKETSDDVISTWGNASFDVTPNKETISIGDSLKLTFEIGDSISLENAKTKLLSIKSASANLFIEYVDSTKHLSSVLCSPRELTTYFHKGNIDSSTLTINLEKINEKFVAVLYIIPKQKGVYYFNAFSRDLLATTNRGNVKAEINWDVSNLNKNQHLILQNIAKKDLAYYTSMLQEKNNDKLALYAFKVN